MPSQFLISEDNKNALIRRFRQDRPNFAHTQTWEDGFVAALSLISPDNNQFLVNTLGVQVSPVSHLARALHSYPKACSEKQVFNHARDPGVLMIVRNHALKVNLVLMEDGTWSLMGNSAKLRASMVTPDGETLNWVKGSVQEFGDQRATTLARALGVDSFAKKHLALVLEVPGLTDAFGYQLAFINDSRWELWTDSSGIVDGFVGVELEAHRKAMRRLTVQALLATHVASLPKGEYDLLQGSWSAAANLHGKNITKLPKEGSDAMCTTEELTKDIIAGVRPAAQALACTLAAADTASREAADRAIGEAAVLMSGVDTSSFYAFTEQDRRAEAAEAAQAADAVLVTGEQIEFRKKYETLVDTALEHYLHTAIVNGSGGDVTQQFKVLLKKHLMQAHDDKLLKSAAVKADETEVIDTDPTAKVVKKFIELIFDPDTSETIREHTVTGLVAVARVRASKLGDAAYQDIFDLVLTKQAEANEVNTHAINAMEQLSVMR